MFGLVAGKLPEIDFKREKALWDLAIIGNEKNILASAKDLNIGGLAIALAKSTIKSGLTVHTKIEFENSFDIFLKVSLELCLKLKLAMRLLLKI